MSRHKMSLFFYIISINCVQVFSYYAFYQVTAYNSRERDFLHSIQQDYDKIYFLTGITNEAATLMDVIVDSSYAEIFEVLLLKHEIEYGCVANKAEIASKHDTADKRPPKKVLHTFLNYHDILLWIKNKLKEHSTLTKIVLGKTYEHRDIFLLRASTQKTKMAVFIVAGEEGRDWLSSAVLLNYIDRILNTSRSPDSLLKYYDIYFIPIINPDGFVYSKNKNRMWTKNRKTFFPKQTCKRNVTAVGVNIDRNWSTAKLAGSKNACTSIFPGFSSLSEEETQTVAFIINKIAFDLLAFINLRGFGNLITLPYSHSTLVPNNHDVMNEIMTHTSAVLTMQYNKTFPVGTTGFYFYKVNGNMPDWVKEMLNIPVVYTIYLQHDNFLPKASDILPLTEQLESILNISLVISKEIYGSLYNAQGKNVSVNIMIVINFICACILKLL